MEIKDIKYVFPCVKLSEESIKTGSINSGPREPEMRSDFHRFFRSNDLLAVSYYQKLSDLILPPILGCIWALGVTTIQDWPVGPCSGAPGEDGPACASKTVMLYVKLHDFVSRVCLWCMLIGVRCHEVCSGFYGGVFKYFLWIWSENQFQKRIRLYHQIIFIPIFETCHYSFPPLSESSGGLPRNLFQVTDWAWNQSKPCVSSIFMFTNEHLFKMGFDNSGHF